ncbi:carbon-nitrogen hydrolase family protein [Leptospira selangorensis]|uniref:Carbon-nitrogen hydrolase family protein n=1 Tax=Leptospira selangorensis TaxID=2484982 RepID=A0ABY2NFN3_9LEPT|nr:nitrilase-related carbon-nitrogen hydrolase [Leptospira selangorensis]TGM23599.1 carbon-nitrogen hydrolase family protein [Leptospira selangorensis]
MRFFVAFSILLSLGTVTIQCKKQSLDSSLLFESLPKPNLFIQKEGKGKRGTVIGMEPYLNQFTYASEESFYLSLKEYFQTAKENDMLFVDRSIVVLPEYIGTWLVVTGEDKSIFLSGTILEAMEQLVKHNLGSFLWHYLFSNSYASDHLKETLFRMKAWQMADRYQSLFSRFAREYRVSILAGSIVLPHPKVVEGKITPTDGPLENVAFYFHPDGRVDETIVRKLFPIAEEKQFLQEGKANENPTYRTPLGRLYTMICADSWFPEEYRELVQSESEILAVPSFVSPGDVWQSKWNGYSGYANPSDVATKDIGTITEKTAWRKYSMLGRQKSPHVKLAINVFFRGELWDLTASGDAFFQWMGKPLNNLVKDQKNQGRLYAFYL